MLCSVRRIMHRLMDGSLSHTRENRGWRDGKERFHRIVATVPDETKRCSTFAAGCSRSAYRSLRFAIVC